MTAPILEILDTGLGVSFQDLGRCGWKRFGVPPGGALDDHAAAWANVLVGNSHTQPVLEILLQGARLRALANVEISLTGAAAHGPDHRWQTRTLERDEILSIPHPADGLWSYLAIHGGFDAPRWFGSASIFPRGGLGCALACGDLLRSAGEVASVPSSSIGHRWVDPQEQRDYVNVPALRVWRGPQWESFGKEARASFFATPWEVSSRSDRTGYRLSGPPVPGSVPGIPSEPVLPGSIQIPPDGQPIITMRDGPTVGGYPKIGVLDPRDLSRLAQCRPGRSIGFEPVG